jgi:hypothetical protein
MRMVLRDMCAPAPGVSRLMKLLLRECTCCNAHALHILPDANGGLGPVVRGALYLVLENCGGLPGNQPRHAMLCQDNGNVTATILWLDLRKENELRSTRSKLQLLPWITTHVGLQ